MNTEQQPRDNQPERVRERELIVTNDGGGRSGMTGVVVGILAILAVVIMVIVVLNMLGDATTDDGVEMPDVNIDMPGDDTGGDDTGGSDDGDGGDTGGDG